MPCLYRYKLWRKGKKFFSTLLSATRNRAYLMRLLTSIAYKLSIRFDLSVEEALYLFVRSLRMSLVNANYRISSSYRHLYKVLYNIEVQILNSGRIPASRLEKHHAFFQHLEEFYRAQFGPQGLSLAHANSPSQRFQVLFHETMGYITKEYHFAEFKIIDALYRIENLPVISQVLSLFEKAVSSNKFWIFAFIAWDVLDAQDASELFPYTAIVQPSAELYRLYVSQGYYLSDQQVKDYLEEYNEIPVRINYNVKWWRREEIPLPVRMCLEAWKQVVGNVVREVALTYATHKIIPWNLRLLASFMFDIASFHPALRVIKVPAYFLSTLGAILNQSLFLSWVLSNPLLEWPLETFIAINTDEMLKKLFDYIFPDEKNYTPSPEKLYFHELYEKSPDFRLFFDTFITHTLPFFLGLKEVNFFHRYEILRSKLNRPYRNLDELKDDVFKIMFAPVGFKQFERIVATYFMNLLNDEEVERFYSAYLFEEEGKEEEYRLIYITEDELRNHLLGMLDPLKAYFVLHDKPTETLFKSDTLEAYTCSEVNPAPQNTYADYVYKAPVQHLGLHHLGFLFVIYPSLLGFLLSYTTYDTIKENIFSKYFLGYLKPFSTASLTFEGYEWRENRTVALRYSFCLQRTVQRYGRTFIECYYVISAGISSNHIYKNPLLTVDYSLIACDYYAVPPPSYPGFYTQARFFETVKALSASSITYTTGLTGSGLIGASVEEGSGQNPCDIALENTLRWVEVCQSEDEEEREFCIQNLIYWGSPCYFFSDKAPCDTICEEQVASIKEELGIGKYTCDKAKFYNVSDPLNSMLDRSDLYDIWTPLFCLTFPWGNKYHMFSYGYFPFLKVENRDVVFNQGYYYFYSLEATPNYLTPFKVVLQDDINNTVEEKAQPHCFFVQYANLIKNEKRLNFFTLFDINTKLEAYYNDVFDSFGREFSFLTPLKVDKLREDTTTCYLYKNFKPDKAKRVKYPALAFHYSLEFPKLYDNFQKVDYTAFLSKPEIAEYTVNNKVYRDIKFADIHFDTLLYLRHIVIQLPYRDYIYFTGYLNFNLISNSTIEYQVDEDFDYSSRVSSTAIFGRNKGVVPAVITKTHFINVHSSATYNSETIETFQDFLILESSSYNAYYRLAFREFSYESPEKLKITRRWLNEDDLHKESYGRYITIVLHGDKDRNIREVAPNEYDNPEELLELVYYYVMFLRDNSFLIDYRYFDYIYLNHLWEYIDICNFLFYEDIFNLLYMKPFKIVVYQRKPRIEKGAWIGRRKLICY